jgi:5-methylcytosine-specific restriction endonuclease McrA
LTLPGKGLSVAENEQVASPMPRLCFLPPPREALEAAHLLSLAVDAHLEGDAMAAAHFIRSADNPILREWTESIWGRNSPHIKAMVPTIGLSKTDRIAIRMPNAAEKAALHQRDGYHCRFCGLPVIRTEVRKKIAAAYPDALPWGRTNLSQHAASQAMWAQYDHLVPHSRGGDNSAENMVVTCAPCNFGRMDYLLDEVDLAHPFARDPVRSTWDGLERFK